MMSESILIALVVLIILLAIGLLLILRELNKLKSSYGLLADHLRRQNEDVAGLCSAALVLDEHMADNQARLESVLDLINNAQALAETRAVPVSVFTEPEQNEQQDYDFAIRKIQMGAGVDDLVKDCGLTRDEAVLLTRLHRSGGTAA
jgi:hypothetical protein